MLGWWKFAGLQLAVVVVLSFVFVAARFYPMEVKKDYLKKSKSWKNSKAKYNEARKEMEQMALLIEKYGDGKIAPSEIDQLNQMAEKISNDYTAAPVKRAYHIMPNLYQVLYKKFYDKDVALKGASSGTCPAELEKTKAERDKFSDKVDDLRKEYDEYRINHP